MKRTNLRRKRPHVLPPLPNLQSSALRPMDPLESPDLLLAGNRLGSPAPRPNISVNSHDIFSANNGNPVIKIFEPSSEKIEKRNMNHDLFSDTITSEHNNLLPQFQKRISNTYEHGSKNSDRENVRIKNHSGKHFEHLHDNLTRKIISQKILPLEESENLSSTFESKILQIPNRYVPLKPIGQDKTEHYERNFSETA